MIKKNVIPVQSKEELGYQIGILIRISNAIHFHMHKDLCLRGKINTYLTYHVR